MSNLTWDDLFLNGSVIQLKTSKWNARTRIKPADLGIEQSEAVDRALSLGCHRLLPRDAFAEIDATIARARQAVEYYSQRFPFVFGARFVGAQNIEKVGGRLKELRQRFGEAVDRFVAAYEDNKAAALPVIEEALRAAARTPEAAAQGLERLRAEYPSARQVAAQFALEWTVYAVQAPRREGVAVALQSESQEVSGMVRAMLEELRGEVQEKLRDVLGILQRGGRLSSVSIASALAVLDHVDTANVLGDRQLRQQVQQLRAMLHAQRDGAGDPTATRTSLETVQRDLELGLDEAVAEAEARLTSVGRRRLEVA